MKTLERYLVREVVATWAAVTVILLLVLMGSYMARYLGQIAAGELPADLFFQVLVLKTIGSLSLLLPASLFIGAMLALGRLYRDSEVIVMSATGIGPLQLYRALAWIALPACIGLALLSLWVAPEAAATSERLQASAAHELQFATLQPGQFQTTSGGRVVYVADAAPERNELQGIMAFAGEGGEVDVLSAARAHYFTDPETKDRYLVLEQGERAIGTPGQADFTLLSFGRNTLALPADRSAEMRLEMEAQPTSVLLTTDSGWYKAELHWRLAAPVSVLVLLLLVVPVARLGPQESRYGKLALGFLIYLAYANLLGLGRAWIEQNQVPAWWGLWWVHALLLALGLAWIWRQYRRIPAPVTP